MVHIDDNIGKACCLQFLELVFEQRFSCNRYQSLWHSVCERFESCAKSCCEYHCSAWRQHLFYTLFAMADVNLHTKLLVYVFCQMLGTIDAAMLTSCTSETEHQTRESTLQITAHMSVSQLVNALQECQDFPIVFKETDDRLVQSCQLLVGLITSWVMCASAIEDIATTIATRILGNALAIGETEHTDHQGALCIIA